MTDAKPTLDRSDAAQQSPGASPASGEAGAGGHGPSAPSSGALAPDEGAAGPSTGTGSHTPDGRGAPEDEVAEVEGDLSELVKTAKQRDDYLALAQRTQADFENYRKRVAREATAARDRGVSALAKELLPALDNLDRALDAAAEDDPLLQGVRLVRTELKAALAR